jgi:coenzyme PQQ precursor peptide PqqA
VRRRGRVHHSTHARQTPLQRERPDAVHTKETDMNWQTPKATDLRFGFEITMYIANR